MEVLLVAGAALTLLSAVGVIRFADVLTRMHALTKASTIGLVLVLIGAAVELDETSDVAKLLLAGVLQTMTIPVSATLLNRASYRAEGIPHHIDAVDEKAAELAERRDR